MQKLLTACIALAVGVVGFAFATNTAEAATIPLDGYAWSENIGWIRFKNGSLYGVTINTATGNFAGHAWSENLGWLSFTSTETASCGTNANLDTQTGVVTGWAKFLSNGECVKLNPPNGVTYSSNSSEFSGYAWGGDFAGWIKWKKAGSNSYVVTSGSPILAPPTAPSNLVATPVSKSQINLTWTNTEQGTKVRIERSVGNPNTFTQIYEAGNANETSYNNTGLLGGTLYYYRLKAFNNNSDESPYSNTASTTTSPYVATIDINVTPDTASWTLTQNGQTVATGSGDRTDLVVNPSGTGTLYTITVGATPSGYDSNPAITNTVTGSGSSMTLFDNQNEGFTITYQRSFDYTLSNNGNIEIQRGGGSHVEPGQITITRTLSPTSGPTQPVDLSASGFPSGVSGGAFSGNPAAPNSQSTLTISVTSSAPLGTFPITVTGSPLGKTTQFNLTIVPSPALTVECVATPTSAQVGQTVRWTANVFQTPAESPYTFTWSGTNVPTEPVPSGQFFDIVYSTTGRKTVDVLVRDDVGQTATCNPDGQINIGVDPDFGEF
jgi:hypothetical protein